ncbi:MAG TPA: DMT family transporter [Candidatus Choladousia intestinigallinarum]|nr:DMT family transporter [Candidatus Choladousia intestinigallinarum]
MLGILIALLSGTLMSVQGVFNTEVTKQTSLWVSSAFVQFTALLVCLAAWAVTDRTSFAGLTEVDPKYMLFSGVLGALITITVVKSMDALGPARAAMLIVIAQLIVAYVIELFGMFGVEKQPFEWRRVLGMAVSIVGIVIFKM